MEQGGGMTEQVLDALRPDADALTDEAQRLQRALRGSSANEATVREHAGNVSRLIARMQAALTPPVPAAPVVEPPVIDMTERAVAPPPTVRATRKSK